MVKWSTGSLPRRHRDDHEAGRWQVVAHGFLPKILLSTPAIEENSGLHLLTLSLSVDDPLRTQCQDAATHLAVWQVIRSPRRKARAASPSRRGQAPGRS